MLTAEEIALQVLRLAKERQNDPATASSDLIASIHATWMEVGLILGKEMERLRKEGQL